MKDLLKYLTPEIIGAVLTFLVGLLITSPIDKRKKKVDTIVGTDNKLMAQLRKMNATVSDLLEANLDLKKQIVELETSQMNSVARLKAQASQFESLIQELRDNCNDCIESAMKKVGYQAPSEDAKSDI